MCLLLSGISRCHPLNTDLVLLREAEEKKGSSFLYIARQKVTGKAKSKDLLVYSSY